MSIFSKIGSSLLQGIRIPFVALILFIIMISLIVLIVFTKPQLLGLPSKDKVSSVSDVEALVLEVSKVIKLPENETPTIGEVSDITKVQNQKFFEQAIQGDKFLIFKDAKKAFLYRPSEKRIIEVGVVNLSQEISPTPTAFPTQIPVIDVSEQAEPISTMPTPTLTTTSKILITPAVTP